MTGITYAYSESRTIRRWTKLPGSFSQLVFDSSPSGLWLRSDGCPHGPVLSARIFDSDGDRACCCVESSSDEELLSEEETSTKDEADSEEDV